MSKVVFTLTGPTCGGKSTLEERLLREGFSKVISTTTRPQRTGDVDGEQYYFTNPTRFAAMVENGEMAEHVNFGGNYYGASKAEFEKGFAAGKPVVVVCEPIGRRQFEVFAEKEGWSLVRVFVDSPVQVQAERFLRRFEEEVAFESDSTVNAKIKTYSKRLAEIMTTERGWMAEAYEHPIDSPLCAYDVIIDRFDEQTADEVVTLLTELAQLQLLQGRIAA